MGIDEYKAEDEEDEKSEKMLISLNIVEGVQDVISGSLLPLRKTILDVECAIGITSRSQVCPNRFCCSCG